MVQNSLSALRENVAMARKARDNELERKKLNKELFELQNPGIQTFRQGVRSGALAFGRGVTVTAKGIQRFAVDREKRLKKMPKKKRRNNFGFSNPLDMGF